MKQIKRRGVAVAAGAALWGVFGAAHALGLGKPNSHAFLGEELTVTVPVRLDAGERLDDECVAADVFFGEEKVDSAQVRAKLTMDANGAPQVRVSTTTAVTEPVVTVYVVAGCQSRITRKFVALADPPGLQLPGNVVESAPLVAQQPVERGTGGKSAVASGAASRASSKVAAGGKAARATAASGPRDAAESASAAPVRESLRMASQARVDHDASEAPVSRRAGRSVALSSRTAAAATGGSRLELDPVSIDALVEPRLKMGAVLATVPDPDADTPELLARRASAAAYWHALQSSPEQMARDRDRLEELERRVVELQAQLRGRTAAAEPASASVGASGVGVVAPAAVAAASAPGWSDAQRTRVTAAMGAVVALLAVVAYVVWRGRQSRRQPLDAWWRSDEPSAEHPVVPEVPETRPQEPQPTTVEFVHVPEHLMPAATRDLMADEAGEPRLAAGYMPSSRQPGAQFTSMFATLPSDANENLLAVAVEELIDLEQQAEFFVVLGQDDAAIDLLEGYVQNKHVDSPLPLLKLLEIYRRLGRRDDYERTQQAFDARFNAHAPGWDDDMAQGHSLADYPEVIERLQALWPHPDQAKAVLEKSLLRPAEGGDTFDLPAYRELLTLYAVARDLTEGAGPKVDVLLPLTSADVADLEGALSSPASGNDVTPLMATRPMQAQGRAAGLTHGVNVDLEVDLQLDDETRA